MEVTREAIKLVREDVRIFMLFLSPDELNRLTTVVAYNPELPFDSPDQGYYYPVKPYRLREISHFLQNGGALQGAITLSARDAQLEYNDATRELTIQEGRDTLYILDGVHRISGASYAQRRGLDTLSGFLFPTVIISGISTEKELELFTNIHTTTKNADIEILKAILAQRLPGEKTPEEVDFAILLRTIDRLNHEDTPWQGKIYPPVGETPHDSRRSKVKSPYLLGGGEKLVKMRVFADSLEPVYSYLKKNYPRWAGKEAAETDLENLLLDVLVEFWGVVIGLLPEASASPARYVLQRSQGVFSLHFLLGYLLGYLYDRRLKWQRENFAPILQNLPELNDVVFWLQDPTTPAEQEKAEAHKYGAIRGYKELGNRLITKVKALEAQKEVPFTPV